MYVGGPIQAQSLVHPSDLSNSRLLFSLAYSQALATLVRCSLAWYRTMCPGDSKRVHCPPIQIDVAVDIKGRTSLLLSLRGPPHQAWTLVPPTRGPSRPIQFFFVSTYFYRIGAALYVEDLRKVISILVSDPRSSKCLCVKPNRHAGDATGVQHVA
jgi:hypothetical protein